jgi:hypothetical protein
MKNKVIFIDDLWFYLILLDFNHLVKLLYLLGTRIHKRIYFRWMRKYG